MIASTSPVAARIVGVTTHVPAQVVTNADLASVFGDWSAAKIGQKTGISERRIAAEEETALDLGTVAARDLLTRFPGDVDFLIFCSQAPDYILPSSACLLQQRLGLPTSVGALDIGLGCSGFVYGLALAIGLIASGSAGRIVLVTADTYSKYIHPRDKSVRTLFGDGAAATLIEAGGDGRIGHFVFGTDGRGANSLIVEAGGFRRPLDAATAIETADVSGNIRTPAHLYMDGAAVMNFTLREVPATMRQLCARSGLPTAAFDYVVMHQANKLMLDALQRKLGLSDAQVPRGYELVGNTVSSTIPFVLAGLQAEGRLPAGTNLALIGFGVGLSWAGCVVTL